jgi:hypothetical protein
MVTCLVMISSVSLQNILQMHVYIHIILNAFDQLGSMGEASLNLRYPSPDFLFTVECCMWTIGFLEEFLFHKKLCKWVRPNMTIVGFRSLES